MFRFAILAALLAVCSAFVAPVSRVAAPVVRASEVNMFYSGPVTGIQIPPNTAPAPKKKAVKKAVKKAAPKKR